MELTRDAAWQLLRRYNKEPFHLRHAVTVAAVMEWYAWGMAMRRTSGAR